MANGNMKSKFTVAYPSFTNFYVNLQNSVNIRSGEEFVISMTHSFMDGYLLMQYVMACLLHFYRH